MAGRGGIVRKANLGVKKIWDPSVLSDRDKSLTQYDGRVARLSADLVWVEAVEPMHQDIDSKKSCGIGPGLMFARSLPGSEQIGLIPCAVGGTKISEWSRSSPLYQSMISRARFAGTKMEALLWYQGESDCAELEDAKAYLKRLQEFVQNVREDLQDSTLVIIMVAVWAENIRQTLPFAEDFVRPAILSMSQTDSRIGVVDAKGLAFLDDNIHLTTESQLILASALLQEYQKLHT